MIKKCDSFLDFTALYQTKPLKLQDFITIIFRVFLFFKLVVEWLHVDNSLYLMKFHYKSIFVNAQSKTVFVIHNRIA